MTDFNTISHDIIHASIVVHKELGPGLLESVCRKRPAKVLMDSGYDVKAEVYLHVEFNRESIEQQGCRIDLLVADCVIVEIKSVETMKPLFAKQSGTYLKSMNLELGLLINFNVPHFERRH